jgi:hypothetical protein
MEAVQAVQAVEDVGTPKAYSKLVGGFKHEVYFPLYMG